MRKVLSLLTVCMVFLPLVVSCPVDGADPTPQHVMFISSNWGDESIIITDDILSLADGATATPRIVIGAATTINHPSLDSLVVDKERRLIYLANTATGNLLVFQNISTISGDTPPVHTFSVIGEDVEEGIALDSARNRLYVSGAAGHIWIFNNTSTRNGVVTPDVVINRNIRSLYLDETNDRLYAASASGADFSVYVYNSASTLAATAVPDRTIVFPNNFNPTAIVVDAAANRLYVGTNSPSPDGFYLFVFSGASAMNGSCDPDTDAVARINTEILSLMLDQLDNLYTWTDSATQVRIYSHASTLSGDGAVPEKTILGVVNRGYGMDYLAY
jgi:hypothetical protein